MTERQKEHNREWLKDLRSGETLQTDGQLATDERFIACCCLGVACKTRARLLGIKNVNDHGNAVPSGAVIKFFGWGADDPNLTGENPEYPQDGQVTARASEWNDDHQASFGQIANMIENTFGLAQE